MQQHIKYLVVEDDKAWSQAISRSVGDYFRDKHGFDQTCIRSLSAYDGDQANQQLCQGRFDLVTLDMNLDRDASGSKISGLDILGEIAAGNSAYFVIIITGAINDPNLEHLYGRDAAALMRYGALNTAVKQIAAERVRILHKPTKGNVVDAFKELKPHLHSALAQYCQVSFERNIFRPLTVKASGSKKRMWEFRFNGGLRRTIQENPGFELYRSAFASPNHEMKVIALMKAIARSSGVTPASLRNESVHEIDFDKRGKAEQDATEDSSFLIGGTDPRAEGAAGVDYQELSGFSILPDTPVDEIQGGIPIESLISGLLFARKTGVDLKEAIGRIIQEYGISNVAGIPYRIAYYLKRENHVKARNELSDDNVLENLSSLLKQVAPMIRSSEQSHRSLSKITPNQSVSNKDKKIRVRTRTETKELLSARQHWPRVRAELKRLELHQLVDHMVKHMIRDKGRLTYHFKPEDGLPPFWLTD